MNKGNIGILLLILVSAGCNTAEGGSVVKKQIDQDVARALPIGADKSEVVAFLSRGNITNSGYMDVGQDEVVRSVFGGAGEIDAAIAARAPFFSLEDSENVKLKFRFDDKGKLVGYSSAVQAVAL